MSARWPGKRRRTPDPSPGEAPEVAHLTESRRGAKAIVAALVVVALIIFVIRNSQRVRVDFIVSKGHFALIWVIVICSILGGVVGFLLGRPIRSRGHRAGSGPGGGSGEGDLPTA